MKNNTLVALLAAAALLCASAADAATRKQKRQKVQRSHAPAVVSVPAAPRVHVDPTMGRNRPAWAGPNECFTDEGYGQIMFDVPLQLGTLGPTQGAFLGDPRTYGVTLRARF